MRIKTTINRAVSIVMALMLAIMIVPAITVHASNIRVTIDGQTVMFPDQNPVIVDDRTLVPVRGVFEGLGFHVGWDEVARAAILTRHDFQLIIPVGSPTFTTNGVIHSLDVPAQIIGDRTMLPIRFPLESVGYNVGWDETTRTVVISTGNAAIPPVTTTVPPTTVSNEVFQAVYRNNVTVIENPPVYSFQVSGDRVIITVYNATDALARLSVGETFVLEPSDDNPGGMSGHVISVQSLGQMVIITAQIPNALEDIFYEFQITDTADLLALGAEIIVSDEYANAPGLTVGRNPSNLFYMRFLNFQSQGVSLTGELALHRPVINHDIGFGLFSGLNIHLLEVVTGATINIDANYNGSLNHFFNLATIVVPIKGVFIEVPLGVRVTATGRADAKFEASIEARFGIRNNNPFFSRTFEYEFEFDFNARIELMAEIQVNLRLFWFIEVYAVFANLGVGLETSTVILNRCPENTCFIVGSNIILRMASRDFGLTRLFSGLRFGPINFLPNVPTSFHYFTNGRWHRACPHRLAAADVYFPLLGEWEGTYTGSQDNRVGLRGITMHIFHDGFTHRVLANIYPIEGGLAGRISYYGNITFDPSTREFHMQGTTLTYNPGGINWSFITFDGEMNNGILTGTNRRPPGGLQGGQVTGPFHITQTAAFDRDVSEAGRPSPGFSVRPGAHHVTGVVVSPATIVVPRGETQQFAATVQGIGSPTQSVLWRVDGANSSGTFISANGLLTVAADETATTLTVRAPSTLAPEVLGTATVTVGAFTLTAIPNEPDFGTHNLGYTNRPTQTITIRNTGNQPITLDSLPSVENWTLSPGSNWTREIPANQTRTFTIRPNHGLPAGIYNPTITITGSNGVSVQVRPIFTVAAGQWAITATPEAPDFGSHNFGYTNRPTQTITIRNTGNQPITLDPLPSVENWTLSPGSNWTREIPVNQTRTFTIRPNHGLPAGTYSPTITITANNGASVQIWPIFYVIDTTTVIPPVDPDIPEDSNIPVGPDIPEDLGPPVDPGPPADPDLNLGSDPNPDEDDALD